ncbi:hypothetical protein [Thalassorhabdomicrobium marinisediminis]|uniref:hypothetical protein n=1 Tax=Thalassorhabdomicrobium marinisediminis TaxID=2170577 RepID=UPI00248FA9BE|nr:hypothetical protein [Thalassorhabdomicrobium marinisediminis]
MRFALPLLFVLATPVLADSYAKPLGATPEAGELGHVYFSVCHPTRPGRMEKGIVMARDAFGWEPMESEADFAFATPDGAVSVTLDATLFDATCEMKISKDVGGDGAALYEDLEAHLSDDTDGALPPAEYTDGGLIWSWERSAPYRLSYVETETEFLITLAVGDL